MFDFKVDQEVAGAGADALGKVFASVDRVDSGSPAANAVSRLDASITVCFFS